jgi:hypothetical protein
MNVQHFKPHVRVPRPPSGLVTSLVLGSVVVGGLTLVGAALMTRADPAIRGSLSFELVTGCPGPLGDLTGTTVTVTSPTGEVVTTHVGPPVDVTHSTPFMSLPGCSYRFEIRHPIEGDTLTFKVLTCSVDFTREYLAENDPVIDPTTCRTW